MLKVALSSPLGCGCGSGSNWGSDDSYGQLQSEEILNVDRHQHGPSCGGIKKLPAIHHKDCKHFRYTHQPAPIVVHQPRQEFLLKAPEVNVYPQIHQTSPKICFSPKVYTKQRETQVQIKPVVVKVEKHVQPRRKMVCSEQLIGGSGLDYGYGYGHSLGHNHGGVYESGNAGWSDYGSLPGKCSGLPSCGCGCN